MTDVAALPFIVLFAVQAVGTITYLLLLGRLFSRLEREHPVVYESLGRPSLILNNSIQNNIYVLRWLWRKEFEGLGDSTMVASARVVRALLVALSVNFAVLALVFFTLGAPDHA